jgi:hypothetical protein
MTTPFHRVPVPQPGETAFGFFRRFAAAMSFDSLRSFEHVAGLHEFGPTSGDEAWARLAAITGLAAAELDPMRWSVGGGANGQDVVIAGRRVRRRTLALQRLRICPTCLEEGGGSGEDGDVRRVHRREWAFRHVVACSRHGTMLVDTCSCGHPLDAVGGARRWACRCGIPMFELAARSASPSQMRAACAVEGMLAGSDVDLPPPFRHLDLDTFVAFLDRYGRACRSGPDAPRVSRKLKPIRHVEQQEPALDVCAGDVEAAMALVEDWPRGFYRLLHDIAGRNAEGGVDVRRLALFATDAGHAVLGPLLDIDGAPVRFVDRRVRFWLLAEHGYRPGERHAVPLAFYERRGSFQPGQRRTPPERLSAAAAAMMLEGEAERERMKDWVATGLLEPGEDGTFAFDDVDGILYVLMHAAAPCERDGDHVALRTLSLRGAGGAYTRAQLLADVMEGRLHVHSDVDHPNLSHLRVDRRSLDRRIEHQRLLDMAGKDLWYPASTVAKTIRAAWPAAHLLTPDAIRAMPQVRVRHVEKWRDGDCQNYHVYSVSDVLMTLARKHGTGTPTGASDTALKGLLDVSAT